MHFLFAFLIIFFSSIANAQIPMKIKLLDIKNKNIETIAVYEGGRIWLNKENRKNFYYDNGKELLSYSLEDKRVKELTKVSFENLSPEILEKFSSKKALKTYWGFNFEDNISAYSIDNRGENFFISDNYGNIFFYDLKSKEYKGRLNLSDRAVKIIKPLKNGALILVNEEGKLLYVERVRIPIFFFLQDLRSSYKISKELNLGVRFVSSIILNENEDTMALVMEHKIITIFKLPTLEIISNFNESGYIRYADFVDNNTIIYSTTTAFTKTDNPFSIESHMAVIAHFFDRSGITIPSTSGKLMLRFENRKELRLYSVNPLRLLVDFGDLIEKGIEVTISTDDDLIIIYSKEKRRFGFYQIGKEKSVSK